MALRSWHVTAQDATAESRDNKLLATVAAETPEEAANSAREMAQQEGHANVIIESVDLAGSEHFVPPGWKSLNNAKGRRELKALLAYVKEDRRVCPVPYLWDELWQMLPGCPRNAGGGEPWPPFILAAWWETSDTSKAERLAYHIRWAYDHNALSTVSAFLRSLPPDQWYRG